MYFRERVTLPGSSYNEPVLRERDLQEQRVLDTARVLIKISVWLEHGTSDDPGRNG